MTAPRLFDADPTTFNPTVAGAVGGELVARQGAPSRVGIVRETAGGMLYVELVVGDYMVALTVTTPGALQQRVLVTVTDRHADLIVGAIVQIGVAINAALTAITPTGTGKVVGASTDSVSGDQSAVIVMETGAAGTASVDLETGGAAAGEVYATAIYPGPGSINDTLTFAP